MSESYLEIHRVRKSFGLKPVLRGVDLKLDAGESLALLGANGAGKTTLLRMLAGLTKPEAGRITLAGLDLGRDTRECQRQVGFVAHQPYLYDDLTALENLVFFARMYGISRSRSQECARGLLERVGLARKARERAGVLSRGQQQRLALARALLHIPRLLLLDEPDTGLDQEGLTVLDELLREHHARGGTLLFTTHDLEGALRRGEQIALLHNGRVAYQQATSGLEQESMRRVYQEVVG